jgi:hypothetical protein
MVFEEKNFTSFMQVIFRGTYWLWFWSLLRREDKRDSIHTASKALDIFARMDGKAINNRL